ncbi:hypothetical protein EVAR_74711_1 [Eumeta japonica]|uniref:JNK1/MAPK8-associated membrane protein n=1 Tax=Eumeta variegata TaxID=151549 RepID=A0A4C1SP15_EUMVA|nr:hypothetical protein EVAR_74711_1 [Eumeta japonica]
MSAVRTCPGLYCGRTELADGQWSDCGACLRGFRTNESSYCIPCTDEPSLYDWQYLGFMVLLPLVLHWFFIDMVTRDKGVKGIISQHVSAFLEVVSGTLAALLVLEPAGSLSLYVCSPKALSDWYTLMHNPMPDYKEVLHCTQEAVYPFVGLKPTKKSPEGEVVGSAMLYSQATSLATGRTTIASPSAAGRHVRHWKPSRDGSRLSRPAGSGLRRPGGWSGGSLSQ